MSVTAPALRAFLDTHPQVARVGVAEAKGSTPREAGAWMLVSPTAIFGTIGGGQLEFMAIDKAREMLRAQPSDVDEGLDAITLSIPLGPEIGQCCGGRVDLSIGPMSDADRTAVVEAAAADDARLPTVILFGGGHVGRALAQALALLPVRVSVVETRPDAVKGFPPQVETKLTPVPEDLVRAATPGAAFVVLTHDHALDFLIVAEALRRSDAAYVGMIGSQTKKATFRSWFFRTAGGSEAEFARLVSPIGGAAVRDKRPAVIAALAAAEIMTALTRN